MRQTWAVIQRKVDAAGIGSPQAKTDLAVVCEFSPEGHAVPSLCHRYAVSRNSASDRPCNGYSEPASCRRCSNGIASAEVLCFVFLVLFVWFCGFSLGFFLCWFLFC